MTGTQSIFRDVTDEEVAEYRQHGWVRLKSFILPATVEAMFERLKTIMGENAEIASHPDAKRSGGMEDYWNTYAPLSVDPETGAVRDDLFYSVSHSPALGAVLTRLCGERMRYAVDQALVKMPAGQRGSGSTFWHVDHGASDKTAFEPAHGQMQVWIALRRVTPSHGSMRLINPDLYTEKAGKIIAEHSVVDSYPLLEAEGVLSEPYTLEVGDATIHGSAVWHSAPPNTKDEPRWGYIVSTFPEDRRWTGNYWWVSDKAKGMVVGKTFPDARFPVLNGR